jgi:hypothetical protein
MRLKLTTLALVFALPVAPVVAFAQDPAPAPAPAAEPLPPPPPPPVVETAPAPAPVAEAAPAPSAPAAGPTIKWEGLVDSYYAINSNSDPSTVGSPGRVYDAQNNSFTLAYAKLGVGVEAGIVGARLDFGYGHTAAMINAANAAFGVLDGGRAAALYGSAWAFEQAYATLKLGVLTLDAGKFNTSAGAEVVPSNKNWLYTRSLLFGGITVNHTGLRGTVAASKEVTIQASVVNGWNNDPENNGDKTFGLSLILTPVDGTLLAANGYVGKEQRFGAMGALGSNETVLLVDVVANQNIGDALAVNLNFDYFKEGNTNWWGLSLMGKYTINANVYLAARGEYLKSKDGGYYFLDAKSFGSGLPLLPPGSMTGSVGLYEGTLCLGIPVSTNYEFRLEGRFDGSDKELFVKGTDLKKNQVTGTAAFLAFF